MASSDGGTRFTKSLERYCLTEDDIPKEPLVVPCRSVVGLSASPKHPTTHRPKVMQTSDLDELKAWIGVPDEAVKGRCLVGREHRARTKEMEALRKQVSDGEESSPDGGFAARIKAGSTAGTNLEAIRASIRSYLYGDSTMVSEVKPIAEAFFGAFEVLLWAFPKVTVKSGSVLLFGPGANSLLASELEIEPGGQVVSYGSLSVHVNTLRKSIQSLAVAPYNLEHLAIGVWGR